MSKRVVIVGGGFGGVRAALKLANQDNIQVKLINPGSYFEYHAALYRSATGRSPLEVTIPLTDFFKFARNVEVVKDAAARLDRDGQCVVGESGSSHHYDELILALGNVTEFYGIPGLDKYAYGVKSIHEALRLKRHLHEQLTGGDIEHTYVVVGGGATGVELSAEMLFYLRHIRKKHNIDTKDFQVILVEAGSQVLGALPEEFARKVERRLRQVGVKLMLNTPVKSENSEYIELPDVNIKSHTVVWTAGVTNNQFYKADSQFKLGCLKRVEVNDYLESEPQVHIIGDAAATPYSGMAQTALHDADFVAENILRATRGLERTVYQPDKPIYAVPVGARWAAVLWGSTKIYGKAGWLLRRLADLRLYLRFLPPGKALTTWRYGHVASEVCDICKR